MTSIDMSERIDPTLPHEQWVRKFERMHDIHSLLIRQEKLDRQGADLANPTEKIYDQEVAEIDKRLD